MSAKLFVRNLSWSVTEDELFHLFSEVGAVLSVKIPTRREDGKPRGFAFIEMGSADIAQAAILRFNGFFLHERDLSVMISDDEGGGRGERGERPARSFSSGPSGASQSTKLFVRGIGYSVTEQGLTQLLQQAGNVYSVKIAMDRDTGTPKGFGFVEMASVEDAQKVIDMFNHHYLEGKALSIEFQNPNRSKSRPAFKGGNRFGGGRPSGPSNRW